MSKKEINVDDWKDEDLPYEQEERKPIFLGDCDNCYDTGAFPYDNQDGYLICDQCETGQQTYNDFNRGLCDEEDLQNLADASQTIGDMMEDPSILEDILEDDSVEKTILKPATPEELREMLEDLLTGGEDDA